MKENGTGTTEKRLIDAYKLEKLVEGSAAAYCHREGKTTPKEKVNRSLRRGTEYSVPCRSL